MLAIVAMAAFSCAKVSEDIDTVQKDESSSKTKVITITAEPDDDVLPDTKTSLSGVSIIWNDLDKVAGYDTEHDKVISDVTTVTDEGKKATFSFEAPLETESFYYLVYPATACGAGDDSEVEVTVPTNQTATANSFAPGANIAFAEVPTDVSKVKFMNIGGLISFIIHNDNISSVEFSANEVMTGIGSVDVITGVATPGAGNKKVIVNGGLTNGNTYYAVVYPNTYTGLKMTITDNTGRIATYSNSNDLIVSRNANLFIAELTIPDGKWVTPSKGKEYMFQFNGTKQFDDWGDNVVQNSMTWTLNKVTVDNTANPGNWDGSSRGQQLGTSSNKITTVSLVGVNYADYCESSTAIGIKEVHVKAGAKNGTTITATVSVGGVAMSAKTSGSDSYTAASTVPGTMTFSSASLLTGDIEITYTLDSPGALYINDISINPDLRTPVNLSFASPEISKTTSNYGTFTGQSVIASPDIEDIKNNITYSKTDPSNIISSFNTNTGVLALNGTTGTATITASFLGDATYKSANKSYTITVASDDDVSGTWASFPYTTAFAPSNNTVYSKVSSDFCGTSATLEAYNSSNTKQSLTNYSGNFSAVYFNANIGSYWKVSLPVSKAIPEGTKITLSCYIAVNSKVYNNWQVSYNGTACGNAVNVIHNGAPSKLGDMTKVEGSYTTTADIAKDSVIEFRITVAAGDGTKAGNNRITQIIVTAE